jgi:transcriptional repressor NrdR
VRVPLLIKRDGRREAYNREKLTKGITIACQKRPVSPAEIEAFIDQLERQLQDSGFNEVHTTDLGERVAGFLKQLDPVAYVRFASVYRQFATLEDFNSEIKKLDYSDRPHNQMEPLAKAEQVKQ